MTPLEELVRIARLDSPCEKFSDHDWKPDGAARACRHREDDDVPGCSGSQTVYRCARCGDWDYGDEPGPGFDDCVQHCGLVR